MVLRLLLKSRGWSAYSKCQQRRGMERMSTVPADRFRPPQQKDYYVSQGCKMFVKYFQSRMHLLLTLTTPIAPLAVDSIHHDYLYSGHLRNYFYVIDTRGGLYLEETKHRNFTSCFKDKQFLNFFYKQMRTNTLVDVIDDDYARKCPYVSLCGKERNFVTPEDPLSALVFVEYDMKTEELLYPVSLLREKVNPELLTLSTTTGRLYHPITTALPRLKQQIGLLHPTLCQQFSENVSYDPDNFTYKIKWTNDRSYPLATII